MKALGNVLLGLGILIIAYSILGRFVGQPTLGLGLVRLRPASGIIFANTLLLLAILTKIGK